MRLFRLESSRKLFARNREKPNSSRVNTRPEHVHTSYLSLPVGTLTHTKHTHAHVATHAHVSMHTHHTDAHTCTHTHTYTHTQLCGGHRNTYSPPREMRNLHNLCACLQSQNNFWPSGKRPSRTRSSASDYTCWIRGGLRLIYRPD